MPETTANPYLDLMQGEADRIKMQQAATLTTAVDVNPDKYATQKRVAGYLGYPVAAVEATPEASQKQASIKQVQDTTATRPVLAAKYGDTDFARLAHDDSDTLGKVVDAIGATAKYVFSAPDEKNTLVGDVAAGYHSAGRGTAGAFRAASEVAAGVAETMLPGIGAAEKSGTLGGNPLRRLAEGFDMLAQDAGARQKAASPASSGLIQSGVSSGVQSFVGNTLMLPLALLPGGEAAALFGMSAQQGGSSYQDAREKGVPIGTALPYAVSQAVIEYATEKLPLHALIGDVKAGSSMFKTLMRQIATEVPGEQLATVLQDMNEWAVLPENKAKPFTDYLSDRPSAAAQTLIATIIGVGGNVAVMKGVQSTIDNATGVQRQAEAAAQDAERFQQLFALAAQSKLRDRSPETFAAMVQQQAEHSDAPTEVYVDARTLAGEGGLLNQDKVAELLPSVAPQLAEALATGGDVSIPVGELIANVAGTPLEKALIEHLRSTPDGLSQFEAKQAQDQAAEYLQSEAARITTEGEAASQTQQSADAVKGQVLEALNAVNRFTPEVHQAYASLVGDFYTVMGERLGLTPEQMYQAYPLRIGGVNPATGGLHQGDSTLSAVRAAWDAAGITSSLREADGTISLDRIVVPKGERGAGKGTAAMQALVAYADATGQRVELSPSTDFGASSRGRLVQFYKQFGFTENKGRAKDFTTMAGMIREPQAAGTFEQSMSTRVPTAKKARENALSAMLVIGLDASKADRNAFEKNVKVVTGYDNYRDAPSAKTPDQQAERFIDHVKANLLWLHDSVDPDTRNRSKLWYDGARNIVDRWTGKFGYTDMQVSGVLAVLSPQKDWFMNVSLGERILDAMTNHQATPWSDEMTATTARIFDKPQYKDQVAEVTGKTLGELQDPILKAMWIRAYDESHNNRNYRLVTPEGGFGDFVTNADGKTRSKSGWGSLNEIGKAVSILENGSAANVSDKLGGQHKVRNFYNNIFDPQDAHGSVTIDTHAVAAGLLKPLSGASPEVTQNFGGGGSASSSEFGAQGTYGLYAEAYRRAAQERGILPREMQSITWEAVRGLFPAGFKSQAKNVDAVAKVWENFKAKRLSLDETRKQILDLAGSIRPPEWIGSATGTHEGSGDSSYAEQLPGAQPPGRGPEPVSGRAGTDVAEGAEQGSDAGTLNQGPRGTFNPSTLSITLLEGADLSTFLHETGHFFLEVMADVASQSTVPVQMAQDMAALLKWFGVKDLATWNALDLDGKRPYHEKFAESFEQYLFEGKAPNQALQPLFQKFRAWMTNVYKSISDFMASHNTALSKDVRGVFDRMLASDEAIAQAETARAYAPLFKSAEQAGMTPQEWAAYQAVGDRATDKAVETLEARSLRDMRWATGARSRALKALQKDTEAKRKTAEAEVQAELAETPVERARAYLKELQKAEAANSKEHKAAMKAWREQYDTAKASTAESVKADENFKTKADRKLEVDRRMLQWEAEHEAPQPALDPLALDAASEMFGYSSGDEMMRAINSTPPASELVEHLTDQRLLERFGDLTTVAGMSRAADEAVHNDARARFIATGLKSLEDAGKQNEKAPGAKRTVNVITKAARQFAEALIARRKLRDVKPAAHLAAETRAGKAALKAVAAGDTKLAIASQRDQLLNHYAAREAQDALAEVEKKIKWLRGFETNTTLPPEYRDQIEKLLERFDLRKTSLTEVDKRKSLLDWVESQRAIGVEPELPEGLLNEAQRQNYRDMTVEEFRGLVDAVKQIEHLGRLKDKLLTAKDQRDFEATRDAIAQSIEDNAGKHQDADTRTPTTTSGRWWQAIKGFMAAHIKAATYARVLDGGKDGGPMWEYFVRGANEAGDKETTMRAEATKALSAILAPYFDGGKMGGKGVYFPSLKKSFNREMILTIALNTGNEGNLQRLLGGEGWQLAQIEPLLNTLSAKDWQVVQNVWDHFESYKQAIGEKSMRVYGVEPQWIEPVPRKVTLTDGTTVDLKGGYYPIKYDPAASVRAEEHADAEGARRQLQGAYGAATTRRSFTKARAEEVVGRPLLYTLSGVYSGVNDVIHDLAWHEWLIDTNRLLKSQAIDSAIREHYGPEVVRQFKTWRDAVAEGDSGSQEALDTALGKLRQGVSIAGLGFNVMSAAMQPLGMAQSIVRIGPKAAARGIMQYIANPVKATAEVHAQSAFMANRARTRFRELNELRNRVQGQTQAREWVSTGAYFLMMQCQQMVDVPTWLGAYEKAISEGHDDARARALSDQAVIDAQGGGQTKDLSAIERGGPAQKLFTVFYSFMNTAQNLGYASRHTGQGYAKATADALLLFVVPAVLGSLLKSALTPGDSGDDKDWKTLTRKLLGEQLAYLMGLLVVGREFGEAGKTALGLTDHARDYSGPAGLRTIADATTLAKQVKQGEFDEQFRKALINMMGDLLALPSAQINRTITGIEALKEGKTKNPAAAVFGYQEPRP